MPLAVGFGTLGHRPPPTEILGSYVVEVRGALVGSGHAAVGASAVTINAQVRDDSGNTGMLIAPGLTLRGYRFSGSGSLAGLPVRITGRIDPPGQSLKTARMVCTLDTSRNCHARVVGGKKDK
jgi:hypothetical protein